MSNVVNDADVAAGSRILTIATVTFECDDFDVNTDTSKVLRTDHLNVPTGRKTVRGESTGTATLQYATAATVDVDVTNQFTTTWRGSNIICTITKVGRKESKAGETKLPISFDVNIGTAVLT